MANSSVVDLRHYLTPDGTLAELPGRARRGTVKLAGLPGRPGPGSRAG